VLHPQSMVWYWGIYSRGCIISVAGSGFIVLVPSFPLGGLLVSLTLLDWSFPVGRGEERRKTVRDAGCYNTLLWGGGEGMLGIKWITVYGVLTCVLYVSGSVFWFPTSHVGCFSVHVHGNVSTVIITLELSTFVGTVNVFTRNSTSF
jgi:hypothetical protein